MEIDQNHQAPVDVNLTQQTNLVPQGGPLEERVYPDCRANDAGIKCPLAERMYKSQKEILDAASERQMSVEQL